MGGGFLSHLIPSGTRVISEEGLNELNYYKYSGTDRSWLSYYVMQSFWNWAINLFPLNIAPNVITLVGFVGMVFACVYSLSFTPTFTEHMPTHAVLLTNALVFLYQTLDALDGKQARRTQNSTPLGQLFDHGCDAVSMCCFAMLGGAIVRQGVNNPVFLTFFFSSLIAFYLAQWEEYWTGVIDLGEVGVTEGQLLGMALYFSAILFGTDVFLKPSFVLLGRPFTIGETVLCVFAAAFIGTTLQNVFRVYKATKDNSRSRNSAILQLLPVASLTTAFLVWIKVSPADIGHAHGIPFLVAAGIFFPACVERMVLARLTKDPVPYVFGFTLPVFLGVAQALFVGNPVYDVYMIRICAVTAILSYLHFAVVVIHQITTYFDISAFKINRPLQWPLKERSKKKAKKAKTDAAPASRSRSKSRTRSNSAASSASTSNRRSPRRRKE